VYITHISENVLYNDQHNVAYLLRARTVEPGKQPLLDNDCVTCNNGVTVGKCIFYAVHVEVIYQGPAAITEES
jgi:hypothetical protein